MKRVHLLFWFFLTTLPTFAQVEKVQITHVYDLVDIPAEFPGGMDSLNAYIQERLVYPPTALEKKIEGICYLQFTISEIGLIMSVHIKKGIPNCPECDQEAIKIIRQMPRWKPASIEGQDVSSKFILPITFKLDQETKSAESE